MSTIIWVLPDGQKLSFFKKTESHKWETILESTKSIKRNVNRLRQTDICIRLRDKVFVCGICCGIRLKEKSEDNIPFVGFESHTYPFMADYFLYVVDYFPCMGDYFPFMGDYFPFMGDNFPLKGNNSPLIGITFGRNFSL